MNRKKRGFTLIEMMMVMGIIGMIIALGIPIYSTMAMGKSLGGAADIIQGSFLKYRETASAKGQPIFLMFEHWRADPSLADEDLDTPRLCAYTVSQDTANPSNFVVTEFDKPIDLPRGIWFNDNWVNTQLVNYTSINPSEPFSAEANWLCSQHYKMSSKSGWAKKLYMIIFLPNGNLAILGRQNIPGPLLEEDRPNEDADVWITNAEDTMLIDINPNTGRTRPRRLNDVVK